MCLCSFYKEEKNLRGWIFCWESEEEEEAYQFRAAITTHMDFLCCKSAQERKQDKRFRRNSCRELKEIGLWAACGNMSMLWRRIEDLEWIFVFVFVCLFGFGFCVLLLVLFVVVAYDYPKPRRVRSQALKAEACAAERVSVRYTRRW